MTRLACLVLLAILLWSPALADPGRAAAVRTTDPPSGQTVEHLAWVSRGLLAQARKDRSLYPEARETLKILEARVARANTYERTLAARALAEGAVAFAAQDAGFSHQLEGSARKQLQPLQEWLAEYAQGMDVHGFAEPAWLRGQPEAVAQAILAWAQLEQLAPDPAGREAVKKFAEGLVALERTEPNEYPYRAHVSFSTLRPDSPAYVTTPAGKQAAGALWVADRSFQVAALVAAGRMLEDPALIAAAEREALGMHAHLVTSGRLVYGFAPRPEEGGSLTAASALVENLMSLYRQTGKRIYAVLGGTAAIWLREKTPKTVADRAAAHLIGEQIARTPAEFYSRAKDAHPPTTYQVMDAENGKTVKKAFEPDDIVYPGGTPGKTVTVGLENMFWMRFDLDRAGDYYFYLVFLKDTIGGGLVSVMMRIDGDKIFQVHLGGASDFPFVDMDLVEGPRPLRYGPHSFGIRFSGLLMTHPAVLDAVVVQPVVELRHLRLPDGRHLLLLNNLSPEPGRTLYSEVQPWPPPVMESVNGDGQEAAVGYQADRRHRQDYLLVPPAGTTMIEWTPVSPPEEE